MGFLKTLLKLLGQAIIALVLLVSSCVGSSYVYTRSAHWSLETIDEAQAKQTRFVIAYHPNNGTAEDNLEVVFYRGTEKLFAQHPALSFNLEPSVSHYDWGGSTVNITTEPEQDGAQLVQIFVMGDTPWASLSEYRVKKNTIHPLRYADASFLATLIGFISFWVVIALINEWMQKKTGPRQGKAGA